MTRVLALAVLLAACGPGNGGTPDNRIPCAAQTTCDAEHRKVCEAGFCSPALPDVSQHLEDMSLSVPVSVRLQSPRAMRAAVIYPITPSGETVRCPGATLSGKQVAIGGMAELSDASKYNLTASLLETQLRSVNDTISSAVSVNGPGRVVYVELYAQQVVQGQPQTGGPAIAIGCVENAPFNDDPNRAQVLVKMQSVE